MAEIISENNDVNTINAGTPRSGYDPVKGLREQIGFLKGGGGWDQAEYGISREAQVAKLEESLAKATAYADSPEGRAKAAAEAERALAEMRTRAINRARLDVSGGKVAVMVAGEPAWHGLGVNVREAVSAAEAIVLAKLNWTIELWRLMAQSEGGVVAPADENRAVVRTDTRAVLGVVGTRYRVFQNEHAFDFMDAVVGAGQARYETAGSLNGGRQVWMQCRIPKSLWAAEGDETIPYVLLNNSHDGTGAIRIMPTTLRVVCNNTLRLSMKAGDREKSLSIRHTESLRGKVAEARNKIGLVVKELDNYGDVMKELADTPLSEHQVVEYVEEFFPTKVRPKEVDGEELLNSILDNSEVVKNLIAGHFAETERTARKNEKILDVILENHERDRARGTAWGAFNAVTQYVDHQQAGRGKTPEAVANNRLQNAWFGAGDQLKQQALESAKMFVQK